MKQFLISLFIILVPVVSFLMWYHFKIVLPEKRRMKAAEKEDKKIYQWFHNQSQKLNEKYKNEIRNFKA